ncbi:MAG: transglutaminase domain-containing protein [Clostridia bacterium]|nr:transglutaminase domain-containing protein [Clostridia bacterium]
MNRKSSTVLIGSAVLGIVMLLAIYMGLIVTGVIDTRPSALVVVAGSAQKQFDGEALECHEYKIKSGKLQKGHRIEAEFDASLTDVGSMENVVRIKIVDEIGADVTNHYKLETRPGKLTVSPCKLVLRSEDAQKVYDGAWLTNEDWQIVTGKLPSGYTADAKFTGKQTVPGTSKNTFAVSIRNKEGAADRNFSISYIYGTLTVLKRPITVTSYGASKFYDGTPLRYESYTVDGELMDNHYLDVTFPESVTNVGTVTNNISVRVRNKYSDGSTGGDVASYYDITVRVGTLEVKPRPIEISASPCIKNHTGDVLPEGKWYITKGSLVEGHNMSARVDAVKNAEGTVEFMLYDVHVFAEQGEVYDPLIGPEDVTYNYEISLVHGIDRDEMEKLTISSGSKSAPYTGEPLTCEQYALMSGVLEDGHVISPFFTGSQTEIGFSDNTFSVIIIDEATGEDVTYRYDIAYVFGILEVYASSPLTGGEISDDGGLDNDVQNQDATAARVRADRSGRVYLRWKSYGEYAYRESTGSWGWGEAMTYPSASYNMLYSTGRALAAHGKVATTYDIEIYGSQYLLPDYTAEGAAGAVNDVVTAPFTMAYVLEAYSWEYSYAEALRYAAAGLDDDDKELQAYAEFVYAQYLSVPSSTREALAQIAKKNGLEANRLSIIEDVADFVRSAAVYDLNYPDCPAGKDEVVYFLTESKSGVCRHFASAATLLYRTLGIPARYVVGYSTDAVSGTWTEVKGADAHAWVEIFIPGLGWVRIDPTPGVSSDTPADALELTPVKLIGYYNGLAYTVRAEHVVITSGSLQEGHEIVYVEVSGSQTEAGQSASVIGKVIIEDETGKDVTSQYHIVRRDGVIEVRRPTLSVVAASGKKVYDGEVLTAQTFTYSFKNADFASTYEVSASVNGSQTEVGQSENVVENVVVTNADGVDVTHNFDIKCISGTLKVYLYELAMSTESLSKTYDAIPLQGTQLEYDADALYARGHELIYTLPVLEGVGSIANLPDWHILDADGMDISDQYDVRISAGSLRIRPIELTLQTNSAQKTYDGRPLRADGYELVKGALAPGQAFDSYTVTGSQTNVGIGESMVTKIRIVDNYGRDVTANYQITILPGTLTVLAP